MFPGYVSFLSINHDLTGSDEMPVAVYFLFLFGSLLYLLPFILNYYLARSRGKNILLMLILSIPFSYIITLVLAYLPEVEKGEETTISGRVLALFYTIVMVAISIPMYRFMMSNSP
jgi:cellobiose-specific phosphotransferase system component IIC